MLLDEIYIKPGIRYSCNHIIGFSVDQPDEPARTVLAILIAPMMGAPAFVVRLLPMYSLKGTFLLEQITIVINLIHQSSGYLFLLMNSNMRTNQNLFSLTHRECGSMNDYAINHPIPNPIFEQLFLFYDPTHLLKNINWTTEKTKTLRFRDLESSVSATAKWSGLVDLYKKLSESGINMTKLNYQTLYPDRFEKQKVMLVVVQRKNCGCFET